MNHKAKTLTTGTITGIAAGCCFGLLNILLGAIGLAGTLTIVNKYGDFFFFPLFSFFGTLFITSLLSLKKSFLTYSISAAVIGLALFFMKFGVLYAVIILTGAALALLTQWRKQ